MPTPLKVIPLMRESMESMRAALTAKNMEIRLEAQTAAPLWRGLRFPR